MIVSQSTPLTDEEKQRNREHVGVCERLLAECSGQLAQAAQSDSSSEIRRLAITAIKQVAKFRPALTVPYAAQFAAALQPSLSPTDPNIRVRCYYDHLSTIC